MKRISSPSIGQLDKRYVNVEDWFLMPPVEDWYDPTDGLPEDPEIGDRYISDATAEGWEIDHIYEWDGDEWIESEPEEGWMIWMLFELMFYVFFSGGWMEVGSESFVNVTGDTMTGDLILSGAKLISDTGEPLTLDSATNYIDIGVSPTNNKQLRFYQGSNGTSGNTCQIRADYDNLYITNANGKIMIENAADQNHSLSVQESGSPYEKMDWWFDGSSGTGTGIWMSANYNAGDINMKLGDADAATWDFKIVDWWDRDLVTISSLGGAHFNIQSKDADFIIEGNTEANLFRVDAGTDEVRMGDWDTTGTVTLTGTARVIRDLWIDAAGIKAPGAKPATEVSFGTLETMAWEFSNEGVEANQESVSWRIAIPYDLDRTEGVIVRLGWSSASAGNCKWQLKYRWFSEDEDMTQDGEETLTAVDVASSTANGLVVTTIEGIDAPSDTDATIMFKLTRLSADGEDTISDTVELHGICFNYTSDKLGAAM